MNSIADPEAEKKRAAHQAMALVERRGANVTKADLAADTGMSRAKVDALFPEEDDLFAAVVDEWYAPDIAIMEEVCGSDLPANRKMYEFFARRFVKEKARYDADPALYALYCELGTGQFHIVQGYIELADHYLTEIIAEAQAEGYFPELTINQALSLINQITQCYTSPQVMLMFASKLNTEKLAIIVDTLFAGLAGADRGAAGTVKLRSA